DSTGGNGGTITLQAAAGLEEENSSGSQYYALPAGLLIINGDLSANGGNAPTAQVGPLDTSVTDANIGLAGQINLNTLTTRPDSVNGRTMPGMASIISTKTGTLNINLVGREDTDADPSTSTAEFNMGAREKFTVLGSVSSFDKSISSATSTDIGRPTVNDALGDGGLTFNLNGGQIVLSDLTIDGDFLIQGDFNGDLLDNGQWSEVRFVNLAARMPENMLNSRDNTSSGTYDEQDWVFDQGLDIVVNGSIDWRRTEGITPAEITGNGNVDPQFSLPTGEYFTTLIHSDFGYIVRYLVDGFDNPVFTAGIDSATSPLDYHILDLRAQGVTVAEPALSFPYDLNDQIRFRRPHEEIFEAVDNFPLVSPAQASELEEALGIGVNMPTDEELRGIAGDHAWFNDMPSTLDASDVSVNAGRLPLEQASSVLKAHGSLFYVEGEIDPETGMATRVDQTDHIREVLSAATQTVTTGSSSADIRSMIDAYGDEASAIMIQLDNLVDEIKNLGLTPRELKIALENLLSNITPGTLTVNQLLEAIQTEVAQTEEAATEEGQAQ
ncbi:MAG: hypothetical protein ACF8OB_12130, partial [Phycisphaeraceae bacterium JB051]